MLILSIYQIHKNLHQVKIEFYEIRCTDSGSLLLFYSVRILERNTTVVTADVYTPNLRKLAATIREN